MKILYKSNAGVIIRTEKQQIAIDLFCQVGELPYQAVSPKLVRAVINRTAPYETLGHMIYTHKHEDHFDAEAVDAYLEAPGKVNLILPLEAAGILTPESMEKPGNSVTAIALRQGERTVIYAGDICITAYSLVHEGDHYAEEEHIAYLIEAEGKKILHVGDARIDKGNFSDKGLEDGNIDLLIVPFPFISRKDGIRMIKEYIRPQKIAVVHLPYAEKDVCGWIRATKKNALAIQQDFQELVLFTEIDQELVI